MANPALSPLAITKQISFGDGRSYAVGQFAKAQPKFKITDRWGRTPDDVRFLNALTRIYQAAERGDLETCRKIVEGEKFKQIDAYCVGRNSAITQERVSPRMIANSKGHQQITDYFSSRFNSAVLPSPKRIGPAISSRETTNSFPAPKLNTCVEKIFYESHRCTYRSYLMGINVPLDDVLTLVRLKISYIHPEKEGILPTLVKMAPHELYQYLCEYCDGNLAFASSSNDMRAIDLYALRAELAVSGRFLPCSTKQDVTATGCGERGSATNKQLIDRKT